MVNLTSALRAEWIKILNYRTFWLLSVVYAFSLLLVLFSVQGIINNMQVNVNGNQMMKLPGMSLYTFPQVWHNLTFIAGYLKIFPAFLIILLITNEYSFKTLRQQIISGLDRREFVASKLIVILGLSSAIVILIAFSGFIAGLLHLKPGNNQIFTSSLYYLPAHLLELVTYFSTAAFFGFLFKRSGVTVILFLIYSYIAERILAFRLPDSVASYLPLHAAGNLVPVPETSLMNLFGISVKQGIAMHDIVVCFGWLIIIYAAIYYILKARDL